MIQVIANEHRPHNAHQICRDFIYLAPSQYQGLTPERPPIVDDLSGKLRRSVAVLSAAIMMFGLSFQPTGKLLDFIEVGRVTPLKVWLRLLVVLIYVFWRYWLDERIVAEWVRPIQECGNRRYASTERHLRCCSASSAIGRWRRRRRAFSHGHGCL